jgi:XTP/dITP diphosphohydrolase
MIELVFATNNKNKLQEVRAILADKITIRSLSDINCEEDIPETGATFHENASQKSHYIVEHYRKNCFADDSGLEVETLNNEPGVYSARYSGSRDMEQNMDLILKNLTGKSNRKAAFITVISLILGGEEYFFEGRINGEIIEERRGSKGFGYDPIFIPEGYDRTFAEMTEEEKNAISHRAIAVKKLVDFLLAI